MCTEPLNSVVVQESLLWLHLAENVHAASGLMSVCPSVPSVINIDWLTTKWHGPQQFAFWPECTSVEYACLADSWRKYWLLSIMLASLQFATYDVFFYVNTSSELWLDDCAADLQLAAACVDSHRQIVELDHASSVHVTLNCHLLPPVCAVVVREWPASFSHDLSAKPWPTIGITRLCCICSSCELVSS